MKNQLNISVVGCGYWGPNLIRNFYANPNCNVKSVCDLDKERLAHIQSIYHGVETTTSIETVMNDPAVDAVVFATPVHTHYEFAKRALLAGKHVYVEKPMASSVTQCEKLNALAKEQNLALFVGHTFVYSSPVKMIKEIIDSDYLGEIFYLNTQRLNLGLFQKDINVAWDLAPHDISIVLYLLDETPVAVNCQGKAHISKDIEDITTISLEFSNNKMAIIQSSWLDPNKIRRMTIVGSERMLLYDDNEPLEKIKIYDKRVSVPPHYDTFAEFHYSYHYGDVRIPYIKQVEPLKVLCQHFLECIEEGVKPETGGEEGLHVVQILEASSESLKNEGAKVTLKNRDTQDACFEKSNEYSNENGFVNTKVGHAAV
jgi:predicted dehydrogenase